MATKSLGPLAQIDKLKAQRAVIDRKISEADQKHVHSLGLIVREAGMEDRDRAFLKGVLREAKSIPENSERYRELSALGPKR